MPFDAPLAQTPPGRLQIFLRTSKPIACRRLRSRQGFAIDVLHSVDARRSELPDQALKCRCAGCIQRAVTFKVTVGVLAYLYLLALAGLFRNVDARRSAS